MPSHKKKSLKKGYAIFALDCVEASETAEHGSTRKHKVNTRRITNTMLWFENGLHLLLSILWKKYCPMIDYLGYFLGKNMLMVISSTIDKNIEISKSMFEFIINFKSI